MGIEFEEESLNTYQSRTVLGPLGTPGMVKFLVAKGVVKSEKSAGVILLVTTLVFFLIAIAIVVSMNFGKLSSHKASPEQIKAKEQIIDTINKGRIYR
jgi:hypothetical protein